MESAQLLLVGGIAVAIAAVVVVGSLVRLRRRRRPAARRIVVVGVGGAGGNAIDRMVSARMPGVEFIACNTDAQVLRRSRAPRRIQIGEKLTGGLGAGGDPVIGQRAAEEDAERIARALAGADMVFVTAGLGGGTGSGAAPVVAAQARQAGALTVGVVTRPFAFEGAKRRQVAELAAEELKSTVDTLLVIPNDGVRNVVLGEVAMMEAFRIVDDLLRQGIEGIVEIITRPGFINLDFADVRSVMKDAGSALMGVGRAIGEDRAAEAARAAIGNPLLGGGISGARGILFNVTGPSDLSLAEVTQAAEVVRAAADPDANVIFGATFDDVLADAVELTVIATGFGPTDAGGGNGRSAAAEPRPTRVKAAPAPQPKATVVVAPAAQDAVEVDELDVPTFLRRPGHAGNGRPRESAH